tara:strand:- start:394 stop:672 length:279 start_codon:yes stop_codon:yes gene_type:complete
MMIRTEEETGHIEGPSWSIAGRFATFKEASNRKEELLIEENLQVKVHWSRRREDFVVKTRADPRLALENEAAARRLAKKRRKAKLNKKRRKK